MLSDNSTPAPQKEIQISELRTAIQANLISFPVPVPVFALQYRAEIQWRLVELYFVHGWSPTRLAARYGITASRVRQAVRSWVHRARTLGYLQAVPPQEYIRTALTFDIQPPPIPAAAAILSSNLMIPQTEPVLTQHSA